MKEISFSETSLYIYQCHTAEVSTLHSDGCENLKSNMILSHKGNASGSTVPIQCVLSYYKTRTSIEMDINMNRTCVRTEDLKNVVPNKSKGWNVDRLCDLVVRVSGYRSRGPGFDSRRYQIFWKVVGPERGRLSLVSITEELLEWKSTGSGTRKPRLTAVGIGCADHATPSIRKSWL
jgi:hypothetical protein